MAAVLKYWTGSAWVAKSLKYWDGSAWVAKPLKYWNGSAWIGPSVVTVYQDNFNRADALLESSLVASGGWSWTWDGVLAGLNILTNQLRCNTTNTTGSVYKTPSVGTQDHYVQFKAVSTTISTGPFVCCRLADTGNYVGIRCGNGGTAGMIEIYRRVSAGSLSNLYASAGGAFVVGDIIRLECSAQTWTYKKNGSVVTTGSIGQSALNNVGTGVLGRSVLGVFCEDFEAGAL